MHALHCPVATDPRRWQVLRCKKGKRNDVCLLPGLFICLLSRSGAEGIPPNSKGKTEVKGIPGRHSWRHRAQNRWATAENARKSTGKRPAILSISHASYQDLQQEILSLRAILLTLCMAALTDSGRAGWQDNSGGEDIDKSENIEVAPQIPAVS